MAEYVPVIISAVLSPNPVLAGGKVLISVAAEDIALIPYTQVITSGELSSGGI